MQSRCGVMRCHAVYHGKGVTGHGNPATPETRGLRATSTETRLYDPAVRYVGPSLWFLRRSGTRVHDTREADSPSILSHKDSPEDCPCAHRLLNKSDFTQFAHSLDKIICI